MRGLTVKSKFSNILVAIGWLLATPLLRGAEADAPRSTGPSEVGTTGESGNGAPPGPATNEHTSKDLSDVTSWEKLQSGPFAETESNRYRLTQEQAGFVIESETTLPEGPGVISYAVVATRERHGTPGLKGTLVFEVDLVDYLNNGEYLNKYMSAIGQPSDHEDPVFGNYLMGWGITIGNIRGFVTGMDDGDRKRAVQFHFDGYSRRGFFSTLCRQISTQDQQEYRRFTQTELMESLKDYFAGKETYEDAVRRVVPYRSMDDATALYSRHWPAAEGGTEGPGVVRGRFGIMLSNDGNTLSWLLDGKVMESCDITGYFDSSTDDFSEGVYVTVGAGAGFRKNSWRFAKPRLRWGEKGSLF